MKAWDVVVEITVQVRYTGIERNTLEEAETFALDDAVVETCRRGERVDGRVVDSREAEE